MGQAALVHLPTKNVPALQASEKLEQKKLLNESISLFVGIASQNFFQTRNANEITGGVLKVRRG